MSHNVQTQELLARRYGAERDPAKRRRGVLAAVTALVVVLVLFVVAAVLMNRDPEVHGEHLAYTIVSDSEVDVTFNVTGPQGATVLCSFEALSEHFTQVGFLEQEVGPLEETSQSVTVRVPTVEPAVAARLQGCSALPGD